ncbi:MAG: glycosyltransferase family 4 protein [Bacteroidales bacterium]|nr:MAG: glycosyltransferase family 4 protein [Bacteroidales bacterium]
MKYAYIGTYPPRECGIGTFTSNLLTYMDCCDQARERANEGFVVAMNDRTEGYEYPPEVRLTVRQEHQRDYIKAAEFINISGADICILEHEFGIFGGEDGIYILPLLHRLEIPFIVTLHTILKEPSYTQKAVLQQICGMASRIIVMSKRAVSFLNKIYHVPKNKIALIEHGVPDLQFSQELSKKEFNLENKKVLLTFGLISRNKGIETAINALPKVVRKHPDLLYLVIGKTHPNVIKIAGEEYRYYLRRLVKELDLENNVLFLNEFINQNDLFKYLSAADIYVTPYLNEAQITSGTLSYAVGVGTAVLSTPYWHAQELLDEGRGRLFDFNNSKELSDILLELLDKPEVLRELRKKAYDYGRKIIWPKIGREYIAVTETVLEEKPEVVVKKEITIDPLILPPFSLVHIKRLTDDTGIIQHAKFGIPNLKDGYCLDDNGRALLMALMTYKEKKESLALDLMPIYLSYIHYMQNKDGTFRNFLSFNRTFLDEVGSEDSFGRAVWALGYLLCYPPNDAYFQVGKMIFLNAAPNFENLKTIRGIANTMIGISYYLKANPTDEIMLETLIKLSTKLIDQYNLEKYKNWEWFESILTYDNGVLPLSLFHVYEIINDHKILETATKTMDFLSKVTIKDGYLSPIGNEKWYKKGRQRAIFAQQPIEALTMVLMFHQAYLVTKNKEYLDKLFTSFMWFLGENDLRMTLYDFETEGCCDGIERYGINRNQGAESSLAYLISHLTVLQAYEHYHTYIQLTCL